MLVNHLLIKGLLFSTINVLKLGSLSGSFVDLFQIFSSKTRSTQYLKTKFYTNDLQIQLRLSWCLQENWANIYIKLQLTVSESAKSGPISWEKKCYNFIYNWNINININDRHIKTVFITIGHRRLEIKNLETTF